MMKKYFKKRCQILAMLLGVSVFILTACVSKEEDEVVNEKENVVVEEAVTEVAAVEAVESVAVEESVVETTVEEIVEPTTEERPVYEGIDLESTLQIDEWIQTFDGIITEPKVIILNDETGRRQIVEDGDRVYFNPDTDYIAVYLPEDARRAHHTHGLHISSSILGENYELCYLDPTITREHRRQAAVIYVDFNGEEVELPFDFMPE